MPASERRLHSMFEDNKFCGKFQGSKVGLGRYTENKADLSLEGGICTRVGRKEMGVHSLEN